MFVMYFVMKKKKQKKRRKVFHFQFIRNNTNFQGELDLLNKNSINKM